MKVSESELVSHLKEFIDSCDADELARIAGDIFGGKCYWDEMNCLDTDLQEEDTYVFEPNEFYGGEFGNEEVFEEE